MSEEKKTNHVTVVVVRDYWQSVGENEAKRLTAGTLITMPQKEAAPLVKSGVLELAEG